VRTHPEWLGGTGRDVTALLRGVPGLVAKDGAEAVYAAALPDGRAAALKIADGSDRARPVVMAALLRRLGVEAPVLAEVADVPVLGHGVPVGRVEAAEL
jgi:L-asparaginase II